MVIILSMLLLKKQTGKVLKAQLQKQQVWYHEPKNDYENDQNYQSTSNNGGYWVLNETTII